MTVATVLARFYRTGLREPAEEERHKLADAVMDRLVETTSNKADAYYRRYAYRTEFKLPGADDDLDQAALADPEGKDITVRLALGARALQARQWPTAVDAFKQVISADEHDPARLHRSRSSVLLPGRRPQSDRDA